MANPVTWANINWMNSQSMRTHSSCSKGPPSLTYRWTKYGFQKTNFQEVNGPGKKRAKIQKHKKTWIVQTYKYCFPILEGHLILRPTTCNEDKSGIWNFKKLITKLLSVGNSEQTINKFNRNGSIPSSQSALRYSFQRDHPTLQRLLACCGNDGAVCSESKLSSFLGSKKRVRDENDQMLSEGWSNAKFSKFSRSEKAL